MTDWRIRISDIQRLIADHQEDGPIYEDQFVTVVRENGAVIMKGKPLKPVFIYE